jgi:hypothetical protein
MGARTTGSPSSRRFAMSHSHNAMPDTQTITPTTTPTP